MSGIHHLECVIGKMWHDKDVLDLLSMAKIKLDKIKLEKDDVNVIVGGKKYGIQFIFAELSEIKAHFGTLNIASMPKVISMLDNMEQLPEGTLFLQDLDIFEGDKIEISNLLPFHLNFNMNKDEVYTVLGFPTGKEVLEYNNASWVFDYYLLIARFDSENKLNSLGLHFINGSFIKK